MAESKDELLLESGSSDVLLLDSGSGESLLLERMALVIAFSDDPSRTGTWKRKV